MHSKSAFESIDNLLKLGVLGSAGYPLDLDATTPAIKAGPLQDDLSSISEFEQQVKDAQSEALQGFIKTPEDLAALKYCIRMHATECVEAPTASPARIEAQKALADLRARKGETFAPLPRNERRLSRKYRAEALQAEAGELAAFIPQWRACQHCN